MGDDNLFGAQQWRVEQYPLFERQVDALLAGESDPLANLCNLVAFIKTTFNFWWVGVYIVRGDELILGPFQVPPACSRILFGKGVCGKAWQDRCSILVGDVDAFPGHIACSSESKSELVIPIFSAPEQRTVGQVAGVLDLDSSNLNEFSEQDKEFFERVGELLDELFLQLAWA